MPATDSLPSPAGSTNAMRGAEGLPAVDAVDDDPSATVLTVAGSAATGEAVPRVSAARPATASPVVIFFFMSSLG